MGSSNQGGPWGGGGGPWGGGSGNGGNGGPGNGGSGNDGNRGNPWGNGGGGNGGGRGPQPPDLDDLLRQGQERLKQVMPGGFGGPRAIVLVVLGMLVAWMATGFYRVNPDQQGVELLFGKFVKTTGPGLNYWFPAPVGEVMTPRVTETRQVAIGGRDARRGADAAAGGQMLTGDQNIIDVDFIVQWRIRDAGEFLFNIRDHETTIRAAAESAMREVIGRTPLEVAMTTGRGEAQTRARDLLQGILDTYKAGVTVLDVQLQKADPPQEVIDAFNDVQRARQDKERLQNEANTYRNDILPRAKGESERLIQEATAYRDRVVKDAEGEAARFLSVYETYRNARDVTTQRLYLETMQDVLKQSDKVILDKAGGAVPYLPLPEVRKALQGQESK